MDIHEAVIELRHQHGAVRPEVQRDRRAVRGGVLPLLRDILLQHEKCGFAEHPPHRTDQVVVYRLSVFQRRAVRDRQVAAVIQEPRPGGDLPREDIRLARYVVQVLRVDLPEALRNAETILCGNGIQHLSRLVGVRAHPHVNIAFDRGKVCVELLLGGVFGAADDQDIVLHMGKAPLMPLLGRQILRRAGRADGVHVGVDDLLRRLGRRGDRHIAVRCRRLPRGQDLAPPLIELQQAHGQRRRSQRGGTDRRREHGCRPSSYFSAHRFFDPIHNILLDLFRGDELLLPEHDTVVRIAVQKLADIKSRHRKSPFSKVCLSFSRPRRSRDFTVPAFMAISSAISAIFCS